MTALSTGFLKEKQALLQWIFDNWGWILEHFYRNHHHIFLGVKQKAQMIDEDGTLSKHLPPLSRNHTSSSTGHQTKLTSPIPTRSFSRVQSGSTWLVRSTVLRRSANTRLSCAKAASVPPLLAFPLYWTTRGFHLSEAFRCPAALFRLCTYYTLPPLWGRIRWTTAVGPA